MYKPPAHLTQELCTYNGLPDADKLPACTSTLLRTFIPGLWEAGLDRALLQQVTCIAHRITWMSWRLGSTSCCRSP